MTTADSRAQLAKIRTYLDAALQGIESLTPGLKLKAGRCTFSHDGSFKFTLEGTLPGGRSKNESQYEALRAALAVPEATYARVPATEPGKPDSFKRGPDKPGLKLPPLGTAFSHNGKRYVIKGATRTKVVAERLDGKSFIWNPQLVAKLTQVGEAA